MPDTLTRWPRVLEDHEAEICGEPTGKTAAPFAVGERVVEIRNPQLGSRVVEVVEPHPRGGYRIGYQVPGTGIVGITYDDEVTRVTEEWREPPLPRLTAVEELCLAASSLSEAPDPDALLEARASDIRGGRIAERVHWYRTVLCGWWCDCGARINPDLAAEQILAICRTADRLEAEAAQESAPAAVVKIAEIAGLRKCPNAPAGGPVVLCGCAPGRCAEARRTPSIPSAG